MKTANESFENRWRNEQEYFPVPPGIDKERERKIYTCGWEDGVREYMNQASADLAKAREEGRREGFEAGWKDAKAAKKKAQEKYFARLMRQNPAEWEMFKARQAERAALHDAKEAGDEREGKKEARDGDL